MRKVAGIFALMGLALFAHSARAEDQKPNDGSTGSSDDTHVGVNDVFKRYGFSQSDRDSVFTKRVCKTSFDLDQQKFIGQVPELQKLGLLNPDLTQTKINSSPNMISMAFMLQVLPTAVKETYSQHPEVDHCLFAQYITRVDDFGNDKRELVASFNFSRALYARINWEKFESQKLMKVAPGFRIAPDMVRAVNAEME